MKLRKKNNLKQEEEQLGEKPKQPFFLLLLFFCFFSDAQARSNIYFSAQCLLAQEKNFELQLDYAKQLLIAEKKDDPGNAAIGYLLCYNATLDIFISEDKSTLDAYNSLCDRAISALEEVSSEDPFKQFCIAEIYFQRSVIRGKFEQFYSAAIDLNHAYKALKENQQKFPAFLPNNKTLGLIKAYLSTVPEQYKWAINLLGFRGDMESGLKMLRSVAHAPNPKAEMIYISKEASYLYAFTLYQVAGSKEEAWKEINRFKADLHKSPLTIFFYAILAGKLNKNEEVIAAILKHPQGEAYTRLHYLDYMMGMAYLHKLDKKSVHYFQKYTDYFKGSNYIKSCYQKMSWHHFIHGNREEYLRCKKEILKQGAAANEDDELAELYAAKGDPDIRLLKARLLYDGGYYDQALGIIEFTKSSDYADHEDKSEYAYRKGRLYMAKGKEELAAQFYIAATKFALNSTQYYGAYSSLYLGEYYLEKGDKDNARLYYQKAMSYRQNKEYRSAIEYRAKLGLKRL